MDLLFPASCNGLISIVINIIFIFSLLAAPNVPKLQLTVRIKCYGMVMPQQTN